MSARRRLCARYAADGTPCTNFTIRNIGWCGRCEGFGTREAPGVGAHVNRVRRPSNEEEWIPADAPLHPEEAYEVSVPRSTQQAFINIHGGTPAAAEAQIRALLEDLLREGRTEQAPDGLWRIRAHGYLLLLSPGHEAVISYRTGHRERTWAQFKAGVPSRIQLRNKKEKALRPPSEEELQAPEHVLSNAVKKRLTDFLIAEQDDSMPVIIGRQTFAAFVQWRTGSRYTGPGRAAELLEELTRRAAPLTALAVPPGGHLAAHDGLVWALLPKKRSPGIFVAKLEEQSADS